LTKNSTATIANEGLKQVTAIYRIEAQIRGLSAAERLDDRQAKPALMVAEFKSSLDHSRL